MTGRRGPGRRPFFRIGLHSRTGAASPRLDSHFNYR